MVLTPLPKLLVPILSSKNLDSIHSGSGIEAEKIVGIHDFSRHAVVQARALTYRNAPRPSNMLKITRTLKNLFIAFAAILLIIPVLLWTYESASECKWFRAHPAPGLLVDIGGYKLHLVCTGAGTPSVLLEAGVGDFSLVWNDIQHELSKSVRTCSYDRGGLGWSDPSPLPRDPNNEVAELHRLLERAHMPPPYILVGHSYGGDLVRVYANHFPEHVAGVVLVEASNEDKWSKIPGMLSVWEGYNKDCRSDIWRSRFGLLRFRHHPLPSYYPEEVRSIAEPFSYMKNAVIANCEEYGALIGPGPSEVGSVRSIGSVPLTVISARKNIFEGSTGIPEREAGVVWKELQSELQHLSSRSNQAIASQSGHYVQHDQPEIVVQQILEMVAKIRSAEAGG